MRNEVIRLLRFLRLFQEIDIKYQKTRQKIVRIFFQSRNKKLIVIIENGQKYVPLTINISIKMLTQCSTHRKALL